MKKTYMTPATQEYRFQAESLLETASPALSVDNSEENGVSSEDDLLSRRRRSVWDEDE